LWVFGANVEEALLGADSDRRDRQALDNPVGVRFEHQTIHERARIALVSVADHVFGSLLRARQSPLATGGKAGTAATAKTRGGQGVDHRFGARRAQAARELPVASSFAVFLDRARVDRAAVLEHDAPAEDLRQLPGDRFLGVSKAPERPGDSSP